MRHRKRLSSLCFYSCMFKIFFWNFNNRYFDYGTKVTILVRSINSVFFFKMLDHSSKTYQEKDYFVPQIPIYHAILNIWRRIAICLPNSWGYWPSISIPLLCIIKSVFLYSSLSPYYKRIHSILDVCQYISNSATLTSVSHLSKVIRKPTAPSLGAIRKFKPCKFWLLEAIFRPT